MSIRNQCQLLGISRSGYYYEGNPETEENLAIMRRLESSTKSVVAMAVTPPGTAAA